MLYGWVVISLIPHTKTLFCTQLSSPFESHNKKDILRQARDLKELIDTAVDDGKLMIPPERAARSDRGLRALAFSYLFCILVDVYELCPM